MPKKIKQLPFVCHELKQKRRQHNLTQAELAQQLNISLSTMQGFEQGKDRPSKQLAKELASRLEDDPEQRVEFERRLREEILDENAYMCYERANAAFECGDYALALTNYQKILSYPISVDMKGLAYQGIGQTFYAQTRFVQAIEAFSSAIQHRPRTTRLYFERGLAYRAIAQNAKAVADYTYLIQHPPVDCSAHDLAFVYYARGVAAYDDGNFEQTISDMTTAIHTLSQYGWAYYFRGLAYKLKHDIENALSDFQQVLQCPNAGGDSWREARRQLNELYANQNENRSFAKDGLE